MVRIDPRRLLDSLHHLRTFGSAGTGSPGDRGVVRQMFSNVDLSARRWLCDQMAEAGLDASIDGVGTVFGRSQNQGPAVIIGSHTDTQPEGGWLDGALGVMYGIEVARALSEDPATEHLAVDVASWADEEGAYTSMLGSRSFCGVLPDAAWQHANADGETVAAAIERAGLANAPRVLLEPERHVSYLEAHIEQGPHLEAAGKQIGVVSTIVGIRSMNIEFAGEQNHAGSTPMAMRKDAGVALFEFGVRLSERLSALASETSVWTIGDARLYPGAESIIAGRAWCRVQFRDPSEAVLDSFESAIQTLAQELTVEGPVAVSAEPSRNKISAVPMEPGLRMVLREAAHAQMPAGWVDMASAAVHDANVLAQHLPSAMLFIPSIGGVSHAFIEDSLDADIVAGAQVLATATASILSSLAE